MSLKTSLYAKQWAFLLQMFAFPEKNGFYCTQLSKKLPEKEERSE